MKAKFFIAAAALAVSAGPLLANTPSADPFGAVPKDQTVQPVFNQNMSGDDAYFSPFDDYRQQNPMDEMRPRNGGSRNNLMPPHMDASGVPDPRI